MDDQELVAYIGKLVDEEHELEQHRDRRGLSDEDHERLRNLDVQLDQCWDLLRQRRARREVGDDPEQAAVRPASTVEHYRQ
jgi:hypothetical protein